MDFLLINVYSFITYSYDFQVRSKNGHSRRRETLQAFFHGFLLAIGLILPLGPQNVFIFNQGALQPTWRKVLPAIFTAGICDTLLISVAIGGVSVVVFSFSWVQSMLYAIGFLMLLYMGWSIWKTKPSKENKEGERMSARKQIAFAVSVSLLNPHAILDTAGIIGTNAISYLGTDRLLFWAACIAVSWLWFFGLALVGRLLGKVDATGSWILRMNRLSALMVWFIAMLMGKKLVDSILSVGSFL